MSVSQTPDAAGIERAVESAIHEHWVLYLVEGIVLVLLGAIAIVVPPIATITFTILIGWLFLISGAVETLHHVLDARRARLLVVAALRHRRYRRRPFASASGRSAERFR